MTRAEICIAACEGLTDEQVKLLVANGGLIQLLEQGERDDGVTVAALLNTIATFPAQLEEARGNIAKMRTLLIGMLAEIEGL